METTNSAYTLGIASAEIIILLLLAFGAGTLLCRVLRSMGICCKRTQPEDDIYAVPPKEPKIPTVEHTVDLKNTTAPITPPARAAHPSNFAVSEVDPHTPIVNLNAATDEHALRDALGLAPAKTVDLHHLGVKTNIHPNIDEVAPTNNPNTVSLDTLATAPVKTVGLADMGVKTNIHAPRDSTTSPSVHVDPLDKHLEVSSWKNAVETAPKPTTYVFNGYEVDPHRVIPCDDLGDDVVWQADSLDSGLLDQPVPDVEEAGLLDNLSDKAEALLDKLDDKKDDALDALKGAGVAVVTAVSGWRLFNWDNVDPHQAIPSGNYDDINWQEDSLDSGLLDGDVPTTKVVVDDSESCLDKLVDKAQDTYQDLKDKAANLVDDAKDLAAKASDTAQDKTQALADSVQEGAQDAKEAVKAAGAAVAAQTANAVNAVEDKAAEVAEVAHDKALEIRADTELALIDAEANVENAVEAAKDKAAEVTDAVEAKAAEVADAVEAKADAVADAAKDQAAEVKADAQNLLDTTETKVDVIAVEGQGFFAGLVAEAKDGWDALKDKAADLSDDAKATLASAADKGEDLTDSAKAKAADAADAVADKTAELTEAAQDKAAEVKAEATAQAVAAEAQAETLTAEAAAKVDDVAKAVEEKAAELKTDAEVAVAEVKAAAESASADNATPSLGITSAAPSFGLAAGAMVAGLNPHGYIPTSHLPDVQWQKDVLDADPHRPITEEQEQDFLSNWFNKAKETVEHLSEKLPEPAQGWVHKVVDKADSLSEKAIPTANEYLDKAKGTAEALGDKAIPAASDLLGKAHAKVGEFSQKAPADSATHDWLHAAQGWLQKARDALDHLGDQADVEVNRLKASEEDGDDFKKLYGIDITLEALLHSRGIVTYQQLADSSADDLKEMLTEQGEPMCWIDPTSWPIQARLAANKDWSHLAGYQHNLKEAARRAQQES